MYGVKTYTYRIYVAERDCITNNMERDPMSSAELSDLVPYCLDILQQFIDFPKLHYISTLKVSLSYKTTLSKCFAMLIIIMRLKCQTVPTFMTMLIRECIVFIVL